MGLAYFDTSALVPLIIAEPTSQHCELLWDEADIVVASSLAFVEVHSALAQASRRGRIAEPARLDALDVFATRWRDVVAIAPSEEILHTAAALSASHALRGYDAVHCATALAAASDDFVAVSGDRELLRAWSDLGIATLDISRA